MQASGEGTTQTFWREVFRSFGFPLIMFACAIVPVANYTFSGHGGFSWLILPLCFPTVVVRAIVKSLMGDEASRTWHRSFYKVAIPAYIAAALPLSWLAVTSIRATFGLPVSVWFFFGIMVSPFPWWYFSG